MMRQDYLARADKPSYGYLFQTQVFISFYLIKIIRDHFSDNLFYGTILKADVFRATIGGIRAMHTPIYLVLANGTVFEGVILWSRWRYRGEIVFATGMRNRLKR